jgi:hypothetical protein
VPSTDVTPVRWIADFAGDASMKLIVVTIAIMILSAAATADDVKVVMVRPVTSFGYLDTDKDARLTPEEAKADWAVAQGFQRADANHDGVLDKEEFATLLKG